MISFQTAGKEAVRLDVVDRDLFAKLRFGFPADAATIAIALSCSISLLCPAWAALVAERPTLVIPMSGWIASVISLQAVAYLLPFSVALGLPLARAAILRGPQKDGTSTRAGSALLFLAWFDYIAAAAIFARFFCLAASTSPGTKASSGSSLVDAKVLAASFANLYHLPSSAHGPAGTRAIGLCFLMGVGHERLSALWARLHAISIT